jgi:hypothetical protein
VTAGEPRARRESDKATAFDVISRDLGNSRELSAFSSRMWTRAYLRSADALRRDARRPIARW